MFYSKYAKEKKNVNTHHYQRIVNILMITIEFVIFYNSLAIKES